MPKLNELTLNMRAYRNCDRSGIALVSARMSEFKQLFAQKPSCDTMIALLNEDFGQRYFDNSRYLERLNQKYLWVTEFNDLPRVTEQMQLQAKPVKYLY